MDGQNARTYTKKDRRTDDQTDRQIGRERGERETDRDRQRHTHTERERERENVCAFAFVCSPIYLQAPTYPGSRTHTPSGAPYGTNPTEPLLNTGHNQYQVSHKILCRVYVCMCVCVYMCVSVIACAGVCVCAPVRTCTHPLIQGHLNGGHVVGGSAGSDGGDIAGGGLYGPNMGIGLGGSHGMMAHRPMHVHPGQVLWVGGRAGVIDRACVRTDGRRDVMRMWCNVM